MKKLILFLVILLTPELAAAQRRIDISYGINLDQGYNSKSVIGIDMKNVYRHWGIYVNGYTSLKKMGGQPTVIYKAQTFSYYGQTYISQNSCNCDSLIEENNVMPYGFTSGLTYTLPIYQGRVTLFAGAGISWYRKQYTRVLYIGGAPDQTGLSPIIRAENSHYFISMGSKVSFEFLADYTFFQQRRMAAGIRAGFNSRHNVVGLVYLGYRFDK